MTPIARVSLAEFLRTLSDEDTSLLGDVIRAAIEIKFNIENRMYNPEDEPRKRALCERLWQHGLLLLREKQ